MYAPNALLRAKHAVALAAVAATMATTVQIGAPLTIELAPSSRQIVATAVALVDHETPIIAAPTIGVADSNLYNLSHDDLVERLNEMKTLGVTSLRIAVPWVYIQPTATTYDWSKMDNVVDTAASMGFSITGAVSGTPTWGGVPLAGAPNPTSYADFASAVASRYGTKIGAYEIWNEPNGVMFFAPVNATKYTEVLKAAYTAIKAANPDAIVLAGALGATGNVKGISQAAVDFLKGMYAAGAAGYFDALSYHPYGSTLPFSAGAGVQNSALKQIQALYAVMVANGDGNLKIWGTEYGNATVPVIGITKTEQAQYLQDFIAAWTRLPFTGPAFVYTAQDLATGMLNAEANYGLFNSDGTPKQAAVVLAKLLAELDATGVVPDYSAPTMSVARDVFLQVASVGFGLANTALIIPNAIIAAAYQQMPESAKKAFTAVATYVSARFTDLIAAVAPMMQAGIGALLDLGPAMKNPQAALNAGLHQFNRDLTNAGKAVTAALNDTKLTLAHLTQPPTTTDASTKKPAAQDKPAAADADPALAVPSTDSTSTTPAAEATTAPAEKASTTTPVEHSTPAPERTTSPATTTAAAPTAVTPARPSTTPVDTATPSSTAQASTSSATNDTTTASTPKHAATDDAASPKATQGGGRHRKSDDNENSKTGTTAPASTPSRSANSATDGTGENTSTKEDTPKHRNESARSSTTAAGTTKRASTAGPAQPAQKSEAAS